jgi:hypothetical protein
MRPIRNTPRLPYPLRDPLHAWRRGKQEDANIANRAHPMFRRNAKRQVVVAASAGVLAWSLLLAFACLGADSRTLRWGDESGYSGEVEARANTVAPCMGRLVCDYSYCAHGFGSFSTDGGLWYEGTFVHGCMDGSGTYETDLYRYVGAFKRGKFHGHGVLTCFVGPRLEGDFVEGTFSGKPVDSWTGPCQ